MYIVFSQGGSKVDEKTKLKFTSFFKNVVIELDKEAYGPDNHLAEWHRGSNEEELDGFTVSVLLRLACKRKSFTGFFVVCLPQVTRPGEETVKCTILLMINHQVHTLSGHC